jgi:hypothetical protein
MTLPRQFFLSLKNQFPMLQYFSDRTFGVEIEFFGLNYVITPVSGNIIKPYCISSRAKDGRNIQQLCKDHNITIGSDKDTWHFEKDTSVRGKGHTRYGAELVSPILRGIEGLVQVYRVFQFLNDIEGLDVDDTCGFHIHHGIDPEIYTCKHLQQLVRIIHPLEQHFYVLIPGNRQNAATCRPMEIDVRAFLDVCKPESGAGSSEIKQLWYSIQNRYDEEAAPYPRYDKTRYHGLNLHSYWYRSTIEFRYHSSLLHNFDEAIQWIIFSQFLIEFSQGNIPDIYFYTEANKWLQTIYDIYLDFGCEERIKKLAN